MSQSQTISQSEAVAASRLHIYRLLFLISILTNLVICFWCIFAPVSFARFMHQPDPFPEGWVRAWGATLLGLHLVYVPGLRNPLFYRLPNWSSIVIKFFHADHLRDERAVFLSICAVGLHLRRDPARLLLSPHHRGHHARAVRLAPTPRPSAIRLGRAAHD